MELLIAILLLVVGFVILIFGADWLVAGASSLAKQFGMSEIAIGLTVVSFGTSMPELVVNVLSSFSGSNDVAFGNVIGSNLFNLLAILGVAGLIYPLTAQSSTVWKETPLSLFAALLLFGLVNDTMITGSTWNGLGRIDAIILTVIFIGFLYYVFATLKEAPVERKLETIGTNNEKILDEHLAGNVDAPMPDDEVEEVKVLSPLKMYGLIFLGLAGLVGGGMLVVNNAIAIATMAGMTERLIGLTIVAAGTSLPELATSAMAAYRKKSDIAIGNVVGSNIFNILFILGAGAFILPTPYNLAMNLDIYLLCIGTIIFFLFLLIGKKYVLERWQAGLMLAAYVAYTVFLIMQDPGTASVTQ